MKVAFFFTYNINPTAGGTERVTSVLAHQLEKLDIDYIYIAHHKRNIREFEREKQYYLPNKKKLVSRENIKFIANLISEKGINILINQDSFGEGSELCNHDNFPNTKCINVIHYNLFGSIKYIKDTIKENRILRHTPVIKFFLQYCMIPFYMHNAYKKRKKLLNDIYNTSDAVVVLSECDKRDYPTKDKSRLHYIPNPITIRCVADKIPKKIILYVGRLVYTQKRVDYLLHVWAHIWNRHLDWTLYICGDGNASSYYKELAQKLQLGNISFEGNVSPEKYYEKASIICLTSTYEGFGLVLTEAMSAGVIPIAFNSFEAINDIIDNGRNGFVIPAFNIYKYSATLEFLIQNHEIRQKMSEEATKKAQMFNINKISKEWIKLFNYLISF